MLIEQARGNSATPSQIARLEQELNQIWCQYNAHLTITGNHFLQQVSRPDHWGQPLSLNEVAAALHSFTLSQARNLSTVPLTEVKRGVIRHDSSNLNIGFVIDPVSKHECSRDVELTTILRKEEFLTRDHVFRIR